MNKSRIGMETGSPEWQKWSFELLRNQLDELLPAYGLDAEVRLLRDEIFRSGRLDDARHVLEVAKRWIAEGRLGYKANIREALAIAQEKTPHFDLTSLASQRLIISRALELSNEGVRLDSPAALAAIATSLGRSGTIPLSEFGRDQERQANAKSQDAATRGKLIQSITRGKSAFPLWSPLHGKAMQVDSSSLEHETTERLKEIDAAVTRYRALRDGERVAPVAQQTDDSITATVPAKASVPFMGGETDLINEKTGVEYTKAEVYHLAKNDLPMFRKLMARSTKRLNEILAGKA
jgi:hypothetical protein